MSSDHVSMSDVPSPLNCGPLSAAQRWDPFYGERDRLWETLVWQTRAAAGRRRMAGGWAPRSVERWSREQAVDELTRNGATYEQRMSALAAALSWRTLTSQQLAAFAGVTSIASRRSRDRDLLFAGGLADEGRFHRPTDDVAGLRLLRPTAHQRVTLPRHHVARLEEARVFAGEPWQRPVASARHNVLMTELALRISEYCQLGGGAEGRMTVLGESQSRLIDLAGAVGANIQITPRAAADAIVVRYDGMLVAIEMTATVNADFDRKVRRWASILEADKSRQLTVLFIECSRPNSPRRSREVYNRILRAVNSAAHRSMGTVQQYVPERMMVARWSDWFPSQGMVSRDFLALSVRRPEGPPADRWQSIELLSPYGFPWEDGCADWDSLSLLSDTAWLFATPHWLRQPTPTGDEFRALRYRAIAQQHWPLARWNPAGVGM